jgi:excisionase family DNA binding protein
MHSLLSVSAAAKELGVNSSRVRAMISSGALEAEKIGGIWLIEQASIAGRAREQALPGRPFSPANAWALLLMASGEEAPQGLGASARWRVRHALESYGLGGLRPRLVRRAEASSYWALPGELRALRDRHDLVLSGPSAAGAYHLDLVGSNAIDAYIPARLASSIQREHALEPVPRAESNVILRVVPHDAWLLEGRRFAPLAKVAVDLCSYPDPRAARTGAELVGDIDHKARAYENGC